MGILTAKTLKKRLVMTLWVQVDRTPIIRSRVGLWQKPKCQARAKQAGFRARFQALQGRTRAWGRHMRQKSN